MASQATTAARTSGVRRLAGALHRRPRLRLALLLTAPLLWLIVLYLGSLAVLFASAFWTTDSFTSQVVKVWSTDNFHQLVTTPVFREVIVRSVGVALAVTVLCALIAFPVAFYTARVAPPRRRPLLVVAILTPLWASYLVKVYAWRLILSQGGLADWLLAPLGLGGPGFGLPATVLTLTYLWLPYMILPIHTALEQLPAQLLDASADLGARAGRTFRSVVLPMVLPSVAAGSVFTFSLSLGDYITVQIVGGKTQLIGNLVYSNIELNLPMAAALGTVPVLVIVLYLLAIRRTGALSSL
ncbi:ABC transporter permease [Streptomyces sp. TR1341]|uniref:Putative spermidine/putrescine transport system permease protein n=1 Tax=Streptomyces murinus TaxID=33900 RepID=A0A7W3NJ38_STRMR|nr:MULTISPECIES: ABC transporter permease [Streptomyces]NDK26383.1 ABC transporter permease [Streptomyces sp. TR1341]MBA9051456.1 putative spermidine/putrescine transport system permease protein [Streptomyces murinus]UWW92832.1 ABC transporter permease subunit [Streptomyces murinus]WSI83453.1 ABC transporter permease [Streptomyces murinus]WUD05180.1 ABC transporter permease [Streptomyces murinus]